MGHPDSAIIINLHGGPGGDYRYMQKASQFASQGYFVVFYDQRGCGLSERHNKSVYSIQIMLDDLTAVINHYRRSPSQKVFLLCHSWGAMLATAYIDKYPARISGAILAEPGGFTWEQTKDYVDRWKPSNPGSEILNDAAFIDQFLTGRESQHEVLDYKYSLLASADWGSGNKLGNIAPVPFWRSGAVAHRALFDIAEDDGFDFTQNLDAYNTKVLFVYSERNKAYGLAHAQLLASSYPQVQIVKTLNGGHDMVWEAWSNFYPDALTYFNSLK